MKRERVEPGPLRVEGEPHPVPLVFGTFFTLLALGFVGIAIFADALALGLVAGAFFGGLGVWAWLECIPPRIELDTEGLSFRKKLRKGRVLWTEVAALGTSIPSEVSPGSLLVRLTPEACAARGKLEAGKMYHFDIPATEACRQEQLLEQAVARWELAGGDGSVFDVLGELRTAGRQLAKSAKTLLELQRQANPEAAAALDAMRGIAPPRKGPEVVALSASVTDGGPPGVPDDIYCAVMHVRAETGDLFFCVVAGGEDLEQLGATIRRVVERLVREHRFNPEFGGELEISLVPDLTPDTAALKSRMNALVAEIEAGFQRSNVVATQARPIRLTWARGHRARPESDG